MTPARRQCFWVAATLVLLCVTEIALAGTKADKAEPAAARGGHSKAHKTHRSHTKRDHGSVDAPPDAVNMRGGLTAKQREDKIASLGLAMMARQPLAGGADHSAPARPEGESKAMRDICQRAHDDPNESGGACSNANGDYDQDNSYICDCVGITDHCQWNGVACDNEGHVIELVADKLHLVRGEPAIPKSIKNLTRLEILKLTFENLEEEKTQGIDSLCGLVNLVDLEMYGVSHFRLPADIGNLVNLRRLDLSGLKIDGRIPASIGKMAALEYLDLSNNQLGGSIPSELGSLVKLKELSLARNGLSGSIPAELGSLRSLTVLDLDGNQLTGTLPSELGNLQRLAKLNVAGNELESTPGSTNAFPEFLTQMRGLTELILRDNKFEGSMFCKNEVQDTLKAHLRVFRVMGSNKIHCCTRGDFSQYSGYFDSAWVYRIGFPTNTDYNEERYVPRRHLSNTLYWKRVRANVGSKGDCILDESVAQRRPSELGTPEWRKICPGMDISTYVDIRDRCLAEWK